MNERTMAPWSHGRLPDWSVVRTDVARQALRAAFDAFDMGRKWAGMNASEDRVWRAVLVAYATAGTAPSVAELSARTDLSTNEVEAVLGRLRGRDLVVLAADGRILGAYPFTDRATEHRVGFGDKTAMAMCGIDALGMGAMFGANTAIRSSCRQCGAPIEIRTSENGQSLGAIAPDTAVVWSGVLYADACAATSFCTVQAFFCSDQHLAAWREDGAHGFRLSIDEAFQVGKAIFGSMLRPSAS